ncbi:sigma-70 family RNA polymerase sigma factor [Lentisphaera profundi]|uniref:Sigma-70 family RNA polymerase sigma factor n=1 Tax=Lentisphaera profundi TaxID=1658616 RepID=A0ABY7W3H9_9BACT|nr:sigma-70 family RNA polymerase sigma factor [Lentisphaera profundi]WDE98818.1 sigma-70 family RNA polymerase sigma factor [Lentisphaera profundi]
MTDKDNYGLFIAEYGKALPALRAFLRQLLPTWFDVDEVIQETSMVLWKKFDQFEPGSSFSAWASMVARFEVLKYRRKKSRDRHVFSDATLELLAEECLNMEDQLSEQRLSLKTCVAKLEQKQQDLLIQSYSRDLSIKELAENEGRSPGSLYKVLDRLRIKLMQCVKENGAPSHG